MGRGTNQRKGQGKTVGDTIRAKFIEKDTKLGRKIMAEPRYARYRNWLGKEIRVDLSTAELRPDSAIETRVQITLPWGESEMVRTAHITGLTADDLEVMYRTALDKRYPTTRAHVKIGKKQTEVAPPMM